MQIFRTVVRALLYIQLIVLVGRTAAKKQQQQQLHQPPEHHPIPPFNRDAINVNNLPIVKDTSLHHTTSNNNNNELIRLAQKDDYIFLNTIDGLFYAIGKHDGAVKWFIKEEAVLTFPKNYENPYFLTDPRDGSLYIFTNEGDGLKKFPYTIAELVSASPSKSADGFLYTGDKKDQWIAIDYRSGRKLDTLTAETLSSSKTLSGSDENMIFIGRTQYTITMFETSSMRKVFNLTYYDYSTHAQHKQQQQNTPPTKPSTQSANINKNGGSQKTDSQVYPYYHFSSSSDGTIVTLDRKTGELIWQLRLDNPIIAMYRYEGEQLFKINFAIFAVEALTSLDPNRFKMLHAEQKLLEQDSQPINNSQNNKNQQIQQQQNNNKKDKSHFVSTLYIGYFKKNFYALPALVYNSYLPSLEGPVTEVIKSNESTSTSLDDTDDDNDNSDMNHSGGDSSTTTTTTAIVIGHHKVPEKFDPPPNYIQPNNNLFVISNNGQNEEDEANSYFNIFGGKQQPSCPADNGKNRSRMSASSFFKKLDQLFDNKYLWTLFTVLIASLLPLIRNVYMEKKKKKRRMLQKQLQMINSGIEELSDEDEMSNSSSNEDDEASDRLARLNESSRGSNKHSSSNNMKKNRSMTSNHDNSFDSVTIMKHSMSSPELGSDGMLKIGKIMYDPTQRLGHGCSGTIVYKGSFEDRPVAVKRLLPECYTLADREVELLKHADQHKNVLRYFCTEADSQFRYIALELCQMTLHEYIHNQYNLDYPPQQPFRLLSILEQATKGLDHLHALDIVHRDIKPHNVLISFPDHKGYVYAMISDFGLCKRLEMGINSFSKKSGVLGTEGWIAPELLDDIYGLVEEQQQSDSGRDTNNSSELQQQQEVVPKRITKSVDIFSMGCVYYFVLTGGSHPFGDSLRRQANILNNEFKTEKLGSANTETYMQRLLIEKMINHEAKERPSTKQVLAHPVFWSKAKTLQFLQDVSDRIEKIDMNDPILLELEKNANQIIRNNWKVHICQHLQNDLKKFRAYNGVCLRDLLRAIRNKKHHYRELTPEVAHSLGSLPDDFVDYFTSRFPKLILHVYEAMICCQDEPMLNVYYTFKESHF